MDESNFLGLDSTAWTALGTLSALAIAVGSVVGASITRWAKRKWFGPKLSLDIDAATAFSSSVDDGKSFWIRVPVKNARANSTAEKIEVFLESAVEILPSSRKLLTDFLPMRLTWTYGVNSAICDRIPGETYKLLDVGVLLPKGVKEITPHGFRLIEPPNWRFAGEVLQHAPRSAPSGIVEVSVIISAENVPPRRQLFRIVFCNDSGGPSARAEKC